MLPCILVFVVIIPIKMPLDGKKLEKNHNVCEIEKSALNIDENDRRD